MDKTLNSKRIRYQVLMLRDVHRSVQPHVECHKAFSMMSEIVIFPPLPVVSILIVRYIVLHYPGDRVHMRSSLAFPTSSIVPSLPPMNQLNSSNAHWNLVPPLVAALLLSKFLH
jgi:hypothetical protein